MNPRPVRWWPLIVLAVLWSAALVWTWAAGERTGQEKVTLTLATGVLALLLALVWLLALSRLPWRRRFGGLALIVGLGAALSLALEFRGVSGNLVPILAWRWTDRGPEAIERRATALAGPVADYPQFLGPRRNATLPGPTLARDWTAKAPREIWRRPIGEGWSAFAVAGEVAVTQEQRGADELVTAYALATGERLWAQADGARYETGIAGVGPRATPTIDGDRVFTLGATGLLQALELATGRELWSHHLEEDFGGPTPDWGRPNSPLVVDGLVVVTVGRSAGGSLVAFDRDDGSVVWQGGSDGLGYSSPTLLELAGARQIVIFNRASVVGHHPADGRVLWSYPWSARQPNVALPLAIGDDRLLVSSGYGEGAKLLEIVRRGDEFAVELIWESRRLKAKFTNLVVHEGYVYGLDDGVLVCLDPATGERCWKQGRYGHGQVLLVDDLLLVSTEKGEVALIDPDPSEHRELARFDALGGKTWNCPALAGRYLLMRNHQEAALFALPLAGS